MDARPWFSRNRQSLKATTGKSLALARLHEKHSTPEEATKHYQRLAAENPHNAHVRHRLAIMAVAKSRPDEAVELFEEALKLEPENAALHNDYGYALYLNDQLDDAIRHLEKAVELKPDLQAGWINLGLALGQQQKFQEATIAFRKANVNEADLHCNLAYLYAVHGLLAQARDEYVNALQVDADCQVAAHGLLQVCEQIQGDEPITVAATMGNQQNIRTRRRPRQP